jgi:hypothetical protein
MPTTSYNYVTGNNLEVCPSLGNSMRVSAVFEAELRESNLCSVNTGEALSRWRQQQCAQRFRYWPDLVQRRHDRLRQPGRPDKPNMRPADPSGNRCGASIRPRPMVGAKNLLSPREAQVHIGKSDGAMTVFRRDPAFEQERACAAYLMIVTGLRIQAS